MVVASDGQSKPDDPGIEAGSTVRSDPISPGAAITPQMLTLCTLAQEQIDSIVRSVPGGSSNIEDIYPLTPLQAGMLFHHLLNAERDTYVLSTLFEIESASCVAPFVAALQRIIDRYDVLRSAVLWEGLPQPLQVVYRRAELSVEEITLERGRDPRAQLEERMRPGRRSMNLQRAPLVELQLALQPTNNKVNALLRVHHVICDHQSLRTIVAETLAVLTGQAPQTAPPPYRSYVAQTLAGSPTANDEAFFRSKLADLDEPTAPFGMLDVHGDAREIEEARCTMDPALALRIRDLGRELDVTPARLFHAAWALVVAHTSGRDDIVYGTVVLASKQRGPRVRRALGMSVNTLPLRLRLTGISARQLVDSTHRELLELVQHEHVPLTVAQRCSGLSGNAPLFTTLFNYRRSFPDVDLDQAAAPGVRVLARGEAWSNYPLSVTVDDLGQDFDLTAQTSMHVGPQRVLGFLCESMRSLLDALATAPHKRALELTILPDAERQRLLSAFNSACGPYPSDALIHEVFAEQAARTPCAVAAAFDSQQLTYAELDGKANKVARFLVAEGIGPDQLVGLCMERSPELFIALLGVLKAGGGYVPLDANHPADRLNYILQDAAPKLVLSQTHLLAKLPRGAWRLIALDEQWHTIEALDASGFDARRFGSQSADLAYVIYTSGSTGQPKGTMVEHRHVLNLWKGLERLYGTARECRRVALNASLTFDASVQQWVQMLSGRAVFLVPEAARRDADLLLAFLDTWQIDGIDCTPSQLSTWIDAGLLSRRCPLRLVLVGGEAIDPALWAMLARSADIAFFNVYGPTECTVDATAAQLNGDRTMPHIGRPMLNRRVYILNQTRLPVPIGVAGEIYIGGAGVGRSYLNRPDLSEQRFVLDLLDPERPGRMYRSGDLGRWRADGTIEYLGRNDDQVKVRGHRIELGEIEVQLLRHEQVKAAAVVARGDELGQKQLVAYVAADPGHSVSVESLRGHLRGVLPEYMVPSAFVFLERLPLTSTGKIDRRSLPVPDRAAYASHGFEPPQGEVEEVVAGIWQVLLPVDRIGRYDNFFELGGHSLLIVQMMERLRRVGLRAELRRVYDNPVLADLAGILTSEAAADACEVPQNLIPEGCTEITPLLLPLVALESDHIERILQRVPGGARNVKDIYPLTPLQEGILFHHLRNEHGGDTYARSVVVEVCSRERLQQLIEALQAAIDRHDVLRSAVLWEQLPQPVQIVYRKAELPVREISLDETRTAAALIETWCSPQQQRIDLTQAPMLRIEFASAGADGPCYVLLRSHHIVGDYISQEIMTSEVIAHLHGQSASLPEPVPYRNHVAQVLAYAKRHDAEAFFRSKLGTVDEPTAPFGLTNVHGDGSELAEAEARIVAEVAARVRAQARRHGVSAATLFHAAWALVVARTSNRDDVVFGTVLVGRLHAGASAQQMLGPFINTLPLRLHLQGLTAQDLIARTQSELVELLNHEQVSLALAQRCSRIGGAAPLFSALLNYRHSSANAQAGWHDIDGLRVLATQDRTNYPIVVSVDDFGMEFRLCAQTVRRIDPQRVVAYLERALTSLVRQLEQSSEVPALRLSILPEQERTEVIEGFNATAAAYPCDKTVNQLFEAQVARAPTAIAAVWEGQHVTYGQLNERANQLARYLLTQGVHAGDCIPVLMARSLQMLVAQIAVLKAGAVYVPIDPDLPAERQTFMIHDCRAQVVLVDGQRVLPVGEPTAVLDCSCAHDCIALCSHSNLETTVSPQAPAYVMYTSGSTGVPKGVVVPHHAVNRLAINNGFAEILPEDCIPHYSNPAFDASTFEIWGALLTGARVLILSQSTVLNAQRFAQVLEQEGATIMWITVGLLNRYVDVLAGVFPQLRYLLSGGDSLEPAAIRRVLRRNAPQHLLNMYGPTECTTFATSQRIESLADDVTNIPIGRPMANARIYILDDHGQPVPVGVPGELYIGGAGVACGYLNRPELTVERFLPDPFCGNPEARMYRTGDLGTWRADGTIEFLGRNDLQVKFRGFRIELGEIEAHLALHPAVKETVVVARQDVPGEKRLVAYFTTTTAEAPQAEHLRRHLQDALPEYMVPSAFVLMETLPLSPSGKVNRRALPPPAVGAYVSRGYEPPLGKIESALVGVWKDVLMVERVGRHDNFFDLGGHSLLALKVLFRLRELLGDVLSVTDLYTSPTVCELAKRVAVGAVKQHFVDLSHEAVLDGAIRRPLQRQRRVAESILLTGATGFVGRFLLAQLLEDTDAKIHCLVRARSQHQATVRLRSTLLQWDLWREEFDRRVIAVPGDLCLPLLGIDAGVYNHLGLEIDAIYHCGTSMNHLQTYAQAREANVGSCRELLLLATAGRPKVINYISTLGVFSAATVDSDRTVSEATTIEQERHLASRGYSASKWVGEKIFMLAGERGIPCNIFRLGLVWADSRQGRYDELQREYRILKTCLLSGYGIRNYHPTMPPTAVDYVAQAIVHLAGVHIHGGGIFHLCAPGSHIEKVFEHCNEIASVNLELLPYHEWIARIKTLHNQGWSLPAVPLVEYAFALDAQALREEERIAKRIRFDCSRTLRELETAGIFAPLFDHDMLDKCVTAMLSRDAQLRDQWEQPDEAIQHRAPPVDAYRQQASSPILK